MTLHKLTCHRDARGHAFLTAAPVALRKVLAVRGTPRPRVEGRCPVQPGWGRARGYGFPKAAPFVYTPAEPSPDKLAVLSLFSGIGGIDLGLEMTGHFYTVGFCEIEAFPRKVLRKHWGAEIPIFEDIHDVTIDTVQSAGIKRVDVIAGGFPCQDISIAGNQAGIKAGTRSGLWFEFARVISELRPRYVVLENVAAITRIDGTRVIADLAEMGYDAQWATLFASDTGAPHTRERWFCVAYAKRQRGYIGRRISEDSDSSNERGISPIRGGNPIKAEGFGKSELEYPGGKGTYAGKFQLRNQEAYTQSNDPGEGVEYSNSAGREEYDPARFACETGHLAGGHDSQSGGGESQPRLGRIFNGLPARLDGGWVARPNEPQHEWEPPRTIATSGNNRNHRIKALGNAVVPQVVAFVGECLWRFHVKQHATHTAARSEA